MNIDCRWLLRSTWPLLIALGLGGCAAPLHGPERAASEEVQPAAPGSYYLTLSRLSAGEFARERSDLAASSTLESQLRLAQLLGHPRQQPPELARALGLLEHVAKAAGASPGQRALARLLIDNYGERQRQEQLLDKLGAQLRDSQRKAVELQEKLDALADIERTLPVAPRSGRTGKLGSER